MSSLSTSSPFYRVNHLMINVVFFCFTNEMQFVTSTVRVRADGDSKTKRGFHSFGGARTRGCFYTNGKIVTGNQRRKRRRCPTAAAAVSQSVALQLLNCRDFHGDFPVVHETHVPRPRILRRFHRRGIIR